MTLASAPGKSSSDFSKDAEGVQADTLLKSYRIPSGFPGLPEDWTVEYETFPGVQDLQLFALRFRKKVPSTPHRVLVLLHGQGEHAGRYLHFPYFLSPEVSEIWAMDLRGHGRSGGLRGHVGNFDLFAEDAALFYDRVRMRSFESAAGRPVEFHLLGHSMGGLIALRFLQLHPEKEFASATVSAPLLAIKMKVPAIKKIAAYGLAKIWGNLQLASDINPALLSRDLGVQKAYTDDRLVHTKATPLFYVELQKAMADLLNRKSGYRCPLQFLIPMRDEVVDSEVTLKYVREMDHVEKELKTYSDFRHESFNELGKEAAFEDLKKWIIKNQS